MSLDIGYGHMTLKVNMEETNRLRKISGTEGIVRNKEIFLFKKEDEN